MTISPLTSARILVVDPDPAVPEVVRGMFSDSDHVVDVDATTTAVAAMEVIDEVDCVVSEYDLPDTDGLSFLARVRDERGDLPFVLYTGVGDETVANEAISVGVSDYVRKRTGNEDVLAHRIVRVIADARRRERTAQVERINAVLREVDGALIRAESRSEIEQSVCDILADSDPYLFTWIGEYVPDNHRLIPRAHAGVEEGFLEQIPVVAGSTLPETGPGPRAIETGEVAVTQNVRDDDAFDDFQDVVLERGFRSVAAVPLAHDGELYGLLAMYADRPFAFDRNERDLLEKLGRDVGYTIHAVQLQADRQKFKAAVEHAGHAVCITDPGGTVEFVNSAFEEQTGYSEAEAVGRQLSTIQPVGPEDVTGELGSIPRGEDWKRELKATRKDGSTYVAEQTIAPIRGRDDDFGGFVAIQADITERREQAEALRRETEMLDSLLETSPIGIVVLSPDGEIRRANKRAEEILELDESAITDRTYDEPEWQFADETGQPIPPQDHPFRRVIEAEASVYDLELRLCREHTEPIWVSINGAPQFGPDGDVERVVFTFDDVTGIKETQRELAETNQTLEALIRAAPVAIVAFDLDGNVVRWSDGAEEIFGWSAEETIGSDPPPHVPADAIENYEKFLRRAADGHSFTGVEVVRERKAGSTVDLHMSAAPIRDADGWVMGVMAVFADLSEQKARERQLRQFRKAVEHAGHSVVITDPDGRIEYVNGSFEEQTGYSAAEAIGRTPAILNSGEHDEAFFEEMWETILNGDVWEREIVNRRKDGTKLHVDQTIAPVVGDDGDIEHFVAVNTDVTDRKEYERELERQNQRLEEFASVVSHDLRNPLNVAEGSLDLLDVDGREAERLAESLDRMAAIIEDVLTLAREGQVVDSTEPLDLEAIAREAWEAMDHSNAELDVGDLPAASGDPDRTRRIFSNLFRNAIEHGTAESADEDGSVHVRVAPIAPSESSQATGFFVADDGPGIDPEIRDSVFESGFTTAKTGTGLGLAIVRRLAEAQGWSVRLTESDAGGARFEIHTEAETIS
ncbi:MAG: PAS domain S-box protein [Halodesulfurarchaeum sp.]